MNAKASPLRRLLQQDVSAAHLLVLCVASVRAEGPGGDDAASGVRAELSDGWYSIDARLDAALSHFVRSSRPKIAVGTKLAISGATLHDCDAGVHPLELLSAEQPPHAAQQMEQVAAGKHEDAVGVRPWLKLEVNARCLRSSSHSHSLDDDV